MSIFFSSSFFTKNSIKKNQHTFFLCALIFVAQCDDEKKTENTETKVENTADSKADSSTAEKKQDKRGIYDFGDFGGGGSSHEWSGHSGHHHHPIEEEKTLTVVKKVPVPYPVVKHVKVEHVKHIPVPVKVHVS